MPDPNRFKEWLESLADKDPRLHRELSARLEERLRQEAAPLVFEAVGATGTAPAAGEIVYETLVREGRPALAIQQDRIDRADGLVEAASREIVGRVLAAAPVVEPMMPLVGRIDVANHPGSLDYLGTGWLVDRGLVVTNRHVAELLARQDDGGRFVFRAGRFGDPLGVAVDYRHELGLAERAPAAVRRVVWIETAPNGADIAFLEVDAAGDGTRRDWIPLAEEDAAPGADVVVVGYPARAPASVIADQAWMDRIYRGTYDVKRIAPGLMGEASRGWATHDCTTLGGNSGSAVLDMKSGRAVALHFAGLYLIENYAVPASVIRRYLRDRPWQGAGRRETPAQAPSPPLPPVPAPAQISFTLPLTVTISLGAPAGLAAGPATVTVTMPPAGPAAADPPPSDPAAAIRAAARTLWQAHGGEGVLAVRPGYVVEGGRLSNRDCLVVAAHPERLDAVRQGLPASWQGLPVEVRAASLTDQLAGGDAGLALEAVTAVAYDDDIRTGPGFSFDWVEEEMTAILHVGPERGWPMLSEFLAKTEGKLVSSMYEFHAAHVAKAIEEELADGAELTLVLARQSRDPASGKIAAGDFDRGETFGRWETEHPGHFERVFVPLGGGGLVATSYHIKVTVRDDKAVWLSSGNWTRTSQPLIPPQSLDDAAAVRRAGNREWHVILENATLAQRFRNHILADYERSRDLGGEREEVGEETWIDVPVVGEPELEAAAKEKVFEPLRLARRLRVKPLLTPDRKGEVYSTAVLELIRSARRQLLLQNQYISLKGATAGFLDQLVTAVIEASRRIEDCRIVLRRENPDFLDDVAELKRRGLDVDRCVRRLSNTHTKGIVVDGERVLVGSHNWSALGVTLNRDASLIFDDAEVARYYRDAFERDWGRAAKLDLAEPTAAPRRAVGEAPPPGFVRMPLAQFLEG